MTEDGSMPVVLLCDGRGIYGIGVSDLFDYEAVAWSCGVEPEPCTFERPPSALILRPDRLMDAKPHDPIPVLAGYVCQAQGIPVLPVHDSLIVPAADAERTAEIMKAAFEQRFPQSRPCEVRIKQPVPQHGKDDGKRVYSGRWAA